MNFAENILGFIKTLHFPVKVPDEIEVMNPFRDPSVLALCTQFYKKFYADSYKRWMIIGINPGRFGGGITGVPFTDPIRLQTVVGIINPMPKKQELSSVFVYEMIKAFGDLEAFYKNFYFTSISPLGFTKNNKNLNYYDDKLLQETVKDFAVDCLYRQLDFGIHREVAFCLGEGKNYHYLTKLNNEQKIFKLIIPLSHPRYIMQYRLKRKEEYINAYIEQFKLFCNPLN
ncbi:MAG: uracil-DNA glycosylase family protein [Chitinophagaceae bacterium]